MKKIKIARDLNQRSLHLAQEGLAELAEPAERLTVRLTVLLVEPEEERLEERLVVLLVERLVERLVVRLVVRREVFLKERLVE
jgi:hypothetical protein